MAELAFDVPASSGSSTVVAKLDLLGAPNGNVDLVVWDAVATGPVDAPAHVLAREWIARAITATFARPWIEPHAPSATPYGAQIALSALLGAFVTLPRGWKLPSRRSTAPLVAEWSSDAVRLHNASDHDAEGTHDPESLVARSVATAWVDADHAVMNGDLDAAIRALDASQSEPLPERWRRARLADLLLARRSPGDAERAETVVEDDALRLAELRARTAPSGPTVASLSALADAAKSANRPLLAQVVQAALERLAQLSEKVAPPAPDRARITETRAPSLTEIRTSDDPSALCTALEREAPRAHSARDAAALWAEAGRVAYYDLEDNERALAALQQARALSAEVIAEDYGALSALEDLYREQGEARGLLAVLELKLQGTDDREMQNVFRITMASVLLDELDEPGLALPLVEAALIADPRLIPAKRKRAEALGRLGRTAEAAATLDEALALPEIDAIEAQDVMREAAAMHASLPAHAERAAALYHTLLETFPSDTEAITGLKTLHATHSDWDAYLGVLDRELAVLAGAAFDATPPAMDDVEIPPALRPTAAEVLREAAAVHLERRGAPAQAVDALRRALALAPDDLLLWELLATSARAAGDDPTLADALETLAPQLLDPSARDAAETEARAARERSQPRPSATTAEVPSVPDTGTAEQQLAAIEARLPTARAPATRRALLERRGILLVDATGQPREALLPLKGALILDPNAVTTRLALVRAYAALRDHAQASDQWRAAADLLASLPPTIALVADLQSTVDVWLASEAAPRSDAWRTTLSERAPAWAAELVPVDGLPPHA